VPLLPCPSDTNSEGSTEKGPHWSSPMSVRRWIFASFYARRQSRGSLASPRLACGHSEQRWRPFPCSAVVAPRRWMPPRRRPPVRRAAVDGSHACAGVVELATALGDLASVPLATSAPLPVIWSARSSSSHGALGSGSFPATVCSSRP
jgi:hypothetical protein